MPANSIASFPRSRLRSARVAQCLFDLLLRPSRPHSCLRLAQGVLGRVRHRALAVYNPLVTFRAEGYQLLIPFSHDLPFNLKHHRLYNSNLVVIGEAVRRKYPAFAFMDIGANIGDTTALLRSRMDVPCLCVEGNKDFIPLCRHNTSRYDNIEIEEAFVGKTDQIAMGNPVSYAGSSMIDLTGAATAAIRFKTIESIVKDHPRFQRAKYIKIDTDGFDPLIIRGATAFLKDCAPTLFFEYDPAHFSRYDAEAFSVFSSLDEAGYQHLIVYDNFGNYLLSCTTADSRLLAELSAYYTRAPGRFCDIAAFHRTDADIFQRLRDTEPDRCLAARMNDSVMRAAPEAG